MLSQSIFTLTCRTDMPADQRIAIAKKNIIICKALGFTGRGFIVGSQALNIIEGTEALLANFTDAMAIDPRITCFVPHGLRPIETREYDDYSIWLDLVTGDNRAEGLYSLEALSMSDALPPIASTRVRLLIDAFLITNKIAA